MTIYASHITSRLQYIATTLLGDAIVLTNNAEVYHAHNGIKINYSAYPIIEGELQIIPVGLLSEEKIQPQLITMTSWNDLPAFFPSHGHIPFDFFAASFYLLSRYEEYLEEKMDKHDRYMHTNSIAWQQGFLDRPLVDEWLKALEPVLRKQDVSWSLPKRTFSIQPTYDVDMAFRYQYSSLFSNITRFFFELLSGNFETVTDHLQVYSGRKKDTYDVYDWLHQLHEQYSLDPVYFFLVAEKQKGVDKNTNPYASGMTNLIQQHASRYTIGIHPSVQSTENTLALKREVQLLQYLAGCPIQHSRHHYLKIRLPETYSVLLQHGIRHDHSMGYGSVNGFRASTAYPFYWYDLKKEAATTLLVHPFCYMDSTAIFHERLNTEMAMERMCYFLEKVRSVNGQFTYVMHNHFLTEQQEWLAWRQLYEIFLRNYC